MNEEFAELLLELAQQSIATSDVLNIICWSLSAQNPKAAISLAQTLEAVAQNPALEVTSSFAALSGRMIQALRSDQDSSLLGVKAAPLFQSSAEELRLLVRRLRGE